MGSEEPSLQEIADMRKRCMSAPPGDLLEIVKLPSWFRRGVGVVRGFRGPLDILRVVNLQHLVAIVVDDLDGDPASFRLVEGAAGGGIQR